MAISYTITKHATAFPSKTLCSSGGSHIYNITLTSDRDNGNFVGKGDFLELDRYKEGAPTTFEGVVLAQANNGEYYVEVVNPGDALFVYQVPMIEEEYNNKFKLESNFYNKKGDTVRAYALSKGDVVSISVEGFTAAPSADGVTVTLSGNKLAE